MSNRSNSTQSGEKGHWHKGNVGAEFDILSKNRYVQIQTAVETASRALRYQLTQTTPKQSVNQEKTHLKESTAEHNKTVASARNYVKVVLNDTQPKARQEL